MVLIFNNICVWTTKSASVLRNGQTKNIGFNNNNTQRQIFLTKHPQLFLKIEKVSQIFHQTNSVFYLLESTSENNYV